MDITKYAPKCASNLDLSFNLTKEYLNTIVKIYDMHLTAIFNYYSGVEAGSRRKQCDTKINLQKNHIR